MGNRLRQMPEAVFVCVLFFVQAAVFLIFRDRSYLQFHDNLDLFVPHYRMMKLQNAWYAHGVTLPVMHGLSRDLFGSEWILYNILHILLPDIAAYLIGYFLKILIGFSGFLLLARDVAGSRASYEKRLPILLPVAAAFGMIPVFPTYGIAFTSVPCVIWLLRRIYYREGLCAGHPVAGGKRVLPYVLLFVYPTLSYFSYHGFFILCYLAVGALILWIRDRKLPFRLFIAAAVLSLGYITLEYRLFAAMLLDRTVTIRTTMEHGELTLSQALAAGAQEFVTASFHSQDSHTYLVLPVVMVGVLAVNFRHLTRREAGRMLRDPVNGLLLWIVLNCLNFGLYQYAPYRHLLESLVPQLTGFEFARTAYFNTFLWYALLAILLCRLSAAAVEFSSGLFALVRPAVPVIARGIACAAAVIVMLVPQVYNDFYYTVYNHAYILLKHRETSRVNYREYYSAPLFERILRDLDYHGEWSCAYGMHPAILNYNGIASLDGYIGFYPQSYKEKWEQVEAPAFAGSPWIKSYFEDWGARVCLYSGSDENTYEALRQMDLKDRRLMADIGELQSLDCRYIFSRIRFSNAEELGLSEIGTWNGAEADDPGEISPYEITVYELPRAGGGTW
ncbi:MAG: DUF6044 family protein [Lachnospiraceae bacterium]|nr:DUF6044 family protein [Lachnospiraceae bacterium]